MLDVELRLIKRACSGDNEAGRNLLVTVINEFEAGKPVSEQLSGYLVEILKGALDASAEGVSAAMHFTR